MRGGAIVLLALSLLACGKGSGENGNRVATKANEIEDAAEAQVNETETELKGVEEE